MVSREPTGALRTILPAAALGLAGLLGVTGCSAGQVTQTDSIEPAVNGNTGQVGDIALRDVRLAYPDDGSYVVGDDVPVLLTIVNEGSTATALESVSSTVSENDAELLGNPSLPGRYGLQVVEPEEPTDSETTESGAETTTGTSTSETSAPETTESAPETSGTAEPPASETSSGAVATAERPAEEPEVGTLSIVLTDVVVDLPTGRNVEVTFRFADGSEIKLALPVATPTTLRETPPADEEGGH